MEFAYEPEVDRLRTRVLEFMHEFVYAAEHTYHEQAAAGAESRWDTPPIMDELKAQARSRGLWNLFLPGSEGAGLSNLAYAPLAEITGRSPFVAPEALIVRPRIPATWRRWRALRRRSCASAGSGHCSTGRSGPASR
jgi:acyl-CoA dehydrogenase